MNVAVSMATFMDFLFAIVSQLFADFDFNCNSFIPETRKYRVYLKISPNLSSVLIFVFIQIRYISKLLETLES